MNPELFKKLIEQATIIGSRYGFIASTNDYTIHVNSADWTNKITVQLQTNVSGDLIVVHGSVLRSGNVTGMEFPTHYFYVDNKMAVSYDPISPDYGFAISDAVIYYNCDSNNFTKDRDIIGDHLAMLIINHL
jgi:hypothetical protein